MSVRDSIRLTLSLECLLSVGKIDRSALDRSVITAVNSMTACREDRSAPTMMRDRLTYLSMMVLLIEV